MYVKLIKPEYRSNGAISWESEMFKVSKIRKTYSPDKTTVLLEFWDDMRDEHVISVTPESIDDIMGYSIDDMLACPDNIYTAVTICDTKDGIIVKSGIRNDDEFFEITTNASNT